mmetsp:Transcript_26245/g.53789  ORF Transcript_26245/g.53789 Transcript_26245/m.53789 type:complete len:203 (-) Transcript_26245:61-669(-)|eukprot:CAMPEP_0183322442 /NCGR_PEP_ID=MMETSP0160_2-20130417/71647_1 /TAXON_ID=2839 ORGANISM="Odontella Sinensis, Strain Grunow 1884" /NCGR_SAMPLE_ID=MMETSP0160_2 /ASSEMBLY_ACC=CAM_ASM_000250 /LENGTH=202 /DNA_ID=CAMNT_0025489609 /DNA_START=90 /DNA_END=698 /DNA_ORIENTATION=-
MKASSPLVIALSLGFVHSAPTNEFIQIRGWAFDQELCWKVRNGNIKKHAKIVLDKCDIKDNAQMFLTKNFVTGDEWEEWYNEASVIDSCDYCDVGGWVTIHPMLDPNLLIGVRISKEKAWLKLEKPNMNDINVDKQVFFDLEGGEVGLGDAKCDYNTTCLFATNQGVNANIEDPVMLSTGDRMQHFAKHGDIIGWWDPFGSR